MQFSHKHTLLPDEDIKKARERLMPYIQSVAEKIREGYGAPESFLNLPIDKEQIKMIGEAVRDKKTPDLKYVIVIGIGGSNLGAKAIYDALYGHTDALAPERFPKCIFLDTTDPAFLQALELFLANHVSNPEEVVVNIVSKSGTTTETVANADLVLQTLEEKWGTAVDRVVVTTDFGSPLWKKAEELEIARLSIPAPVGGRYSVFSAAGLFPLAMCDININTLLEGAREAREQGLKEEGNDAFFSAATLFLHNKAGKTIHDTFIFNPQLKSLGEWYRQLLGESIGKENDKDGNQVRTGIMPTVSAGTADLHSVGQLYLAGPRERVTTFVWANTSPEHKRTVANTWGLADYLSGKGAADILDAARKGTQAAYEKEELPFMDVELGEVNAYELGAFMQFKMCEVMYLAYLLNVNAFDQPNVELFKEETRKNLV